MTPRSASGERTRRGSAAGPGGPAGHLTFWRVTRSFGYPTTATTSSARLGHAVSLENTIRAVTCADVVASGGVVVHVDQAPEDRMASNPVVLAHPSDQSDYYAAEAALLAQYLQVP